MALKQDYILRMIEELINVLINTIGGKRKDEKEFVNEHDLSDENELLIKLKALVDEKKINEAENFLFEKIEDGYKKDFYAGMAFYKYLNEKDDTYLENANYSREEIVEGLADLSKRYGFGDFVTMFMKA